MRHTQMAWTQADWKANGKRAVAIRFAKHGTRKFTERGLQAAEGRFLEQARALNPGLPEGELRVRARYLRKAFYIELGRKSAAARREKRTSAGRQGSKAVAISREEDRHPSAAAVSV